MGKLKAHTGPTSIFTRAWHLIHPLVPDTLEIKARRYVLTPDQNSGYLPQALGVVVPAGFTPLADDKDSEVDWIIKRQRDLIRLFL